MIHSYLITDPQYYTTDLTQFKKILFQNIKEVDFALYRDKKNPNYDKFAKIFVSTCQQSSIKAILHQNYKLAYNLNAYGIHFIFSQIEDIKSAKEMGLFVVVSTHTLQEAKIAQKYGADAITFSPIYKTPNKATPVGLSALKEIIDKISIKVIALGGITTYEQIKAVEECGAFAYASIRKFIKGL